MNKESRWKKIGILQYHFWRDVCVIIIAIILAPIWIVLAVWDGLRGGHYED